MTGTVPRLWCALWSGEAAPGEPEAGMAVGIILRSFVIPNRHTKESPVSCNIKACCNLENFLCPFVFLFFFNGYAIRIDENLMWIG